ncbi:MAG: hypothetical protein ABIU09_01970 [Pyrinomonadaceae bacterium]
MERVKEIKFLQSDRDAVKRILHDYNLDYSSESSDEFSFADTSLEVFYSTGTCDEDENEIWDVPKDRVTRIEIRPDAELKLEVIGLDLSKFSKEQIYADVPDRFIYHNKEIGMAIKVEEDEVDHFILFPVVNKKAKTCQYKAAKEFVSSKSWFGSKKLEDRQGPYDGNFSANVTDLSLSHEEISALSPKQITVSVDASDPENDVLTYIYIVSTGNIAGTGAKVVWELTGVGAGTYTITAGVDDGCGICGQTKTKTVVIK